MRNIVGRPVDLRDSFTTDTMARAAGLLLCFCIANAAILVAARSEEDKKLPEDFLMGFATTSYSVEGGWKADGKGLNIWDKFTHEHPEKIVDRTNGDIAADSYHKYGEDVRILKKLGAQIYRFSLSWSRILPNGLVSSINQPGIDYYNHLIDLLHANGIQPMVTLFGSDLPQALQDLGGWSNPFMADYFEEYARVAFRSFGDRVKWWITIEDPFANCVNGYGWDLTAPGVNMPGVGEYLCGHSMLLAHAQAYHLYDDEFRPTQNGSIGISLNGEWLEPKSENSQDVEAADTAYQFYTGWFANPIFSEDGDYPAIMKLQIEENSYAAGMTISRLPNFDNETIEYISDTADFFGLSHVTTLLAQPAPNPVGPDPSWIRDMRVWFSQDDSWPTSPTAFLRVVPWGLRKILNKIKNDYGNPPVFITLNGISDLGDEEDTQRISYHTAYLQEMLTAVYEDGCDVFGYTAYSLLDGFTWNRGYRERFGVYKVDFNDRKRTRTPKASAEFFRDVITSRKVPSVNSSYYHKLANQDINSNLVV